jgi:small subunit ribosomal protein S1
MTSSLEAPRRSSTPQVAINDIGSAEDFLAAIDETIKYFNDGDIVDGTIVKVDRDEVLLDIGYKTEASSRPASCRSSTTSTPTRSSPSATRSRRSSCRRRTRRAADPVQEARPVRARLGHDRADQGEDGVVTGTVIEVVKGGLILDIGLRGFLPASLVEMRRVRDLQPYVGKEIEAKIIELDKNRNNVVLSRAPGWSRPSPRSARTS